MNFFQAEMGDSNGDLQWLLLSQTTASYRKTMDYTLCFTCFRQSYHSYGPLKGTCYVKLAGLHTFEYKQLSCNANQVGLFHYSNAYLFAKIRALDPSNNRKRCLEKKFMQQELQATILHTFI